MTQPDGNEDLWSDPRPARQRGVWDEWEALLRARRDGRLADADYRRATAALRARLDQLGQEGETPGEMPGAGWAPPATPAPRVPAPPEPSPRARQSLAGGELAKRYGPTLTFLALVLILSVAAGYTITRLAS